MNNFINDIALGKIHDNIIADLQKKPIRLWIGFSFFIKIESKSKHQDYGLLWFLFELFEPRQT